MKIRKYFFPLFVCGFLTGLNIVNSNMNRIQGNVQRIVGLWIFLTGLLSILWFVNSFLRSKQYYLQKNNSFFLKIAVTLAINLVLILLMASFANIIENSLDTLGRDVPLWGKFFKLSVASFFILVVQQTTDSLQEKQEIKLQNERLQNENLKTALGALQQQINPHFLFNALSTLRSMIHSKDPNAEKFVLHLSDVYRQLLAKRDSVLVELSEEMQFLHAYLFMLQSRFEDMLQVSIDISPGSQQRKIPVFSLQLLIENAIKHNVVSASKPLRLSIYENQDDEIVVENNLQLKTTKEESSGIGLMNLKKRYELLEVKNGVTITQSENAFIVALKLL